MRFFGCIVIGTRKTGVTFESHPDPNSYPEYGLTWFIGSGMCALLKFLMKTNPMFS